MSTNGYNESEINESAERVNTYIDVHQKHPGYFDAAIMTGKSMCTFYRTTRMKFCTESRRCLVSKKKT